MKVEAGVGGGFVVEEAVQLLNDFWLFLLLPEFSQFCLERGVLWLEVTNRVHMVELMGSGFTVAFTSQVEKILGQSSIGSISHWGQGGLETNEKILSTL